MVARWRRWVALFGLGFLGLSTSTAPVAALLTPGVGGGARVSRGAARRWNVGGGAAGGGGWPVRGLMAAASFVWRRLAVRCAPLLLPCPPACSGAFQPGFLATAGPVRFGMGGRGSRVESFVTQKFQGGLGGGGGGGRPGPLRAHWRRAWR